MISFGVNTIFYIYNEIRLYRHMFLQCIEIVLCVRLTDDWEIKNKTKKSLRIIICYSLSLTFNLEGGGTKKCTNRTINSRYYSIRTNTQFITRVETNGLKKYYITQVRRRYTIYEYYERLFVMRVCGVFLLFTDGEEMVTGKGTEPLPLHTCTTQRPSPSQRSSFPSPTQKSGAVRVVPIYT